MWSHAALCPIGAPVMSLGPTTVSLCVSHDNVTKSPSLTAVGAENLIRADQAPCRAGPLVPEMILSCVPTTPLPDDHPDVRMAAPVAPRCVMEVPWDSAPAAPAHGPTAPGRCASEDELGGPGTDRGAPGGRPSLTVSRPAPDRHAGNRAALAP
jgi:hypothetical protein